MEPLWWPTKSTRERRLLYQRNWFYRSLLKEHSKLKVTNALMKRTNQLRRLQKKQLRWCLQTHCKQIYSAMHTKLWKCLWIIRSWVSLFWSSCFEQYEVYFTKKYWLCSKPFIFVGIQTPNTEIEENSKQIIVLLFTTMKLLPLSFV